MNATYFAVCDCCGKRCYSSRRMARRARRAIDRRLRVYYCTDGGAAWHLGHLSRRVLAGVVDRRALYGGGS